MTGRLSPHKAANLPLERMGKMNAREKRMTFLSKELEFEYIV